MSYDITIESERKIYLDRNYTSNTYKMFKLAFDCDEGIKILNENSKPVAMKILINAIHYFINNKEELEKLNPTNGWGCYGSSLELLKEMYNILKKSQSKTIKVYISC